MAFVPGFEHDLFISYSWIDNETSAADEKGWVTHFDEQLQLRLQQRVSRRIEVWRDRNIQGSTVFTRVTLGAAEQSAVFLSLTSPNCLTESKYCALERRAFFEKAQTSDFGLTVNSHFRLANLLLYNLPFSEWPKEYGKNEDASAGFPFYQRDAEAGADDPGKPSQPGSEVFDRQLDRLVRALRSVLMAMSLERTTAPSHTATEPPPDAFKIFFADVPESLAKVKKNTLTQLGGHPVHLLAKVPPPHSAAAHQQAVVRELKSADLSVHLLNDSPGREIDDAPEEYYPVKQAELALAHAPAQLIWLPKGFDRTAVADDNYQKFFNRLPAQQSQQANLELCESLPAEITQLILDKKAKLERLRQSAAPPSRESAILMDCHQQDEATTYELAALLQQRGVPHRVIAGSEHEPEQKRQYYAQVLSDIAVLVVLFGQVGVDYVVERIRAAQKIVTQNNYALAHCGIYLSPPQKSAKAIDAIIQFIQQHNAKIRRLDLKLIGTPEELLAWVQGNGAAR